MKAVPAVAFVAVSLVVLVVVVRDAGSARATGVGPDFELGASVGLSVPVIATTSPADPYSGFNVHIRGGGRARSRLLQ
jgi:hypothetical protein